MAYLSDELYTTVTRSVPIVCVDVVPVRKTDGDWEIGIITRATGSQAGMPAILGGRVWHNETIPEAIKRHMQDSLQISDFTFLPGNDTSHPFYVQQYMHQESAEPPLGYDPTKHAIALTYTVELSETPKATQEASEFRWTSKADLPSVAGYNQELVMKAAFDFLEALESKSSTI